MIEDSRQMISRRTALRGALALSAGLAVAGLTGCSSARGAATDADASGRSGSASPSGDRSSGSGAGAGAGPGTTATTATTATSAAPARGGQLRLVALGTPTATLNPLTTVDTVSFLTLFQIYDQLVRMDGDTITNSLAESVEPNADATMWTVRLRSGASFHHGKPVTAADAAYSIRAMGDPKRSPNYSSLYADVDLANIAVLDQRTLRIPLHRARGDFRDAALSQMSLVFPDGTTDADWNTDIGSGPFKLVSTGTEGNVLAAYPDYWGGAPLLDGATVSAVADPQARLNAVRAGQADYAVDVTPTGARSVANATDVQIRRGGAGNSIARSFEMNMTKDPFTDATVRQALKLLVDRQQLLDTILLGQGQLGNDVYGLGLPGYDTSLPQRERDVEKAKSLLAAAGVSRLTIKAADLISGTVDAANLLAEQAREAGLSITVQQAAADTYFNDYAGVLATPLQAFYFINRPAAAMISTYSGTQSTFNVSGVGGTDYDARLAAAQSTVDDKARAAKFADLQHYLWDSGGDLVWGFAEQLDAITPGLGGVTLCQSAPLLATAYLGS